MEGIIGIYIQLSISFPLPPLVFLTTFYLSSVKVMLDRRCLFIWGKVFFFFFFFDFFALL